MRSDLEIYDTTIRVTLGCPPLNSSKEVLGSRDLDRYTLTSELQLSGADSPCRTHFLTNVARIMHAQVEPVILIEDICPSFVPVVDKSFSHRTSTERILDTVRL